MYYSVDRADGEYVMLCDDDGETREIRRFHFEGDVKTGGIYRFEQGRFIYDGQETARRKARIRALEEEVFE
ncbi:MAG: DUF3006 domain-containing protein [Ruminococcus sp.]|nr:DUF3006 domain-containing protein [Ruminococcus sp.]